VPRRSRTEAEGAIHHVYSRGNDRDSVFRDDADRQVYLVILKGVVLVYDWRILAFCLMGNHVHLIVKTRHANLGAGMQRLHGHYGRMFNRRYDRSGHVFKRPYGAVLIETERQLAAALGYVTENPVKANLCGTAGDWPWSSAATAGWVLGVRPHLGGVTPLVTAPSLAG
jgi:REP element-mobilizing transposase RayT